MVPSRRGQFRDERGASVSVFVAACMPAFILICGLVVDGSARLSAERTAHAVAARAARAGCDAAAVARLGGQADPGMAVAAAQEVVSGQAGMTAEVEVTAEGRTSVHTHTSVDTQFLSLIGIDRFEVSGRASADLRPTRPARVPFPTYA